MTGITSNLPAPQHGPRPLPLFLAYLWRETENDPLLRQAALRGLRRYQEIPRPSLVRPHRINATRGGSRLLHLAPDDGGAAARQAVVLVPSLVNSHMILDLSDGMSLARHLAGAGFDPWLIDWGTPRPEDASLDLAGHVEHRLVPLIRSIGRPASLVGYCLGGTMVLGAAALVDPVSVATIAAPWHFDRYPETERKRIADLWQQSQPLCERLGYVPMEVLQNGFWSLDPVRTVRKYAAFADMEPGSETERAFLAVEDWANEGAPLSYAAGRDLFEHLYGGNATGEGRWTIGGRAVSPQALSCPTLSIRSTTDRIVPADAAPPLNVRRDSPLGHVGMVVSRKAPEQIWRVLSDWLSSPDQ